MIPFCSMDSFQLLDLPTRDTTQFAYGSIAACDLGVNSASRDDTIHLVIAVLRYDQRGAPRCCHIPYRTVQSQSVYV